VLSKTLLRTLALAAALSALALTAVPASASGDYIHQADGADISWPQCDKPLPAIPQETFGIVGVNNGETFTMNPCFRQEWNWMKGGHAGPPSVYINVNYGSSTEGYSQCTAEDAACGAYDFGYKAAEFAYTRANYETNGESLKASTWWLDVETMSTWNDNQQLNARVVAGAIDYLQTTGHKIGVYSTRRQWNEITGGYNPGAGIGNWVAGADGLQDYSLCSASFWAGAPVWLIQFLNFRRDLDEDHSC
jgi:hypothetical protein